MSVGGVRTGGLNPLEDGHDHDHDHDHADDATAVSGATREPSSAARDVLARLQATTGSGWSVFGVFDSANDVGKLASKLGQDGTVTADEVQALVAEAKDFQRITPGEQQHLIDVLAGKHGVVEPAAREALALFLGVADPLAAAPAAPAAPSTPTAPAAPASPPIASGPFKGFTQDDLKTLFPIDMSKGRLTSHFGANDVYRAQGSHKGIDLANVVGTPIRFPEDGKITWVSRENTALPKKNRGYGNSIWVEFPDGHKEIFAHLNKEAIDKLVGAGTKAGNLATPVQVRKGQTIPGGIGNSGNTTGPHLHWEVRLPGSANEAVNPLWWAMEQKKKAAAAAAAANPT